MIYGGNSEFVEWWRYVGRDFWRGLAVSEALSLIPTIKANGIFQAVYGLLKRLGGKVVLIAMLCVGLTACATVSAVKSDATPKQTAQAVCSDLQTTITAASALVAWTSLYFPNQAALLTEAGEYLSLTEESRAAACASVDLVVDTESLEELVTTKQATVLTLIGRINSVVAKIKGG